jgi:DNA end-binding protein Ku
LLNVPVTVYPGEQRHDITFHLVDSRDHARVRYQRVNEDTGEEVPWSEIVKAFEYDDGSYVLMTEDDLANVAVEASQTVEIQSFVPRTAIDTLYFEKPYFLEPGKRGEKGYVLLREVLARTERVGIARVVIRTREYLAALMPWGNALVLELLRYPQELRDVNDLDLPAGDLADYKITKKELEMAESLLEAMSAEWEPATYQDEYRAKLREYIESKAQGEDRVAVPDSPDVEPTNIVDIMSVLRKSIEAKASPARGKSSKNLASKTAGSKTAATRTAKATAKKATKKVAKKVETKVNGKANKKSSTRAAAPKARRAAG